MLDDLRDQAGSTAFEGKEDLELEEAVVTYQEKRFLGMTAGQRFIISLMLLIIACLLSTFCLLVTEKIIPPFL